MSNKQKLIELLNSDSVESMRQAFELNKVLNLFPPQRLLSELDSEQLYKLFENLPEVGAVNDIFDKIRKKHSGKNADTLAGFFPVDTGYHNDQTEFYMFLKIEKVFPFKNTSTVLESIKKLSAIEKDVRSGIASAKGISLAGEVLVDPVSEAELLIRAKLDIDLDFFISRL